MVDMIKILSRQKRFSVRAFGPGCTPLRNIDHIKKELVEVEEAPDRLEEWIDIAMLAMDGAMRAGHTPHDIAHAYVAKLAKNEKRQWPDWRTANPDKAIEHVRKPDETAHNNCEECKPIKDQLLKVAVILEVFRETYFKNCDASIEFLSTKDGSLIEYMSLKKEIAACEALLCPEGGDV